MDLSKNISKEHILKAIEEIDASGRKDRSSYKYDLIFNSKTYPPLLVLAIANKYTTSVELPANFSRGGWESEEFKFLKNNGFIIKEKKDVASYLIQSNSDNIRNMWDQFKLNSNYKKRKKQEKFSELAREIIEFTLNKGELTNEKLTGFIQIFKPSVHDDTFRRYLSFCIEDEKKEKEIFNRWKELNETGFTEAGLNAIKNLNPNQLEAVKDLLLGVLRAFKVEDIKKLIEDFESKNIPYVKYGVFSPWLYYLKPEVCPIVNSVHRNQLKKVFWSENYADTIDIFRTLSNIVGEEDLGTLDWFFLENEGKEKFLLEKASKYETYPDQVMVYEIKSSADKNSEELFSKDKNYFYWNQDKFENLKTGDGVFVVNTHSKYVLYSIINEKGIEVVYDQKRNSTYFEDNNNTFNVSGKYGVFVKLKILQNVNLNDWKWKSLGSSETTYLKGIRVSKESAENNLERINSIKLIFSDFPYINNLLEICMKDIKEKLEYSFFNELEKFLVQTETDDLKTKHFLDRYNGLSVKVSFGQGNSAKIPWISFLGEGQSTSNGIYPVYLLYKEINLLVLAYGISETSRPHLSWEGIDNLTSIFSYLKEHYNHIPERYGSSLIVRFEITCNWSFLTIL